MYICWKYNPSEFNLETMSDLEDWLLHVFIKAHSRCFELADLWWSNCTYKNFSSRQYYKKALGISGLWGSLWVIDIPSYNSVKYCIVNFSINSYPTHLFPLVLFSTIITLLQNIHPRFVPHCLQECETLNSNVITKECLDSFATFAEKDLFG